jgi:hypothetical protein
VVTWAAIAIDQLAYTSHQEAAELLFQIVAGFPFHLSSCSVMTPEKQEYAVQ